jgi:hypothetical protein
VKEFASLLVKQESDPRPGEMPELTAAPVDQSDSIFSSRWESREDLSAVNTACIPALADP